MKTIAGLIVVVAALVFFGPGQTGSDDDLMGAGMCNANFPVTVECKPGNEACNRHKILLVPGVVNRKKGPWVTCGIVDVACSAPKAFRQSWHAHCTEWIKWPIF